MPGRGKTIQTKLNTTNNDNAWKTIGRAKRNVPSTQLLQDTKETKKTDLKSTPPRPIEQPLASQDPLQPPLPDSPSSVVLKSSSIIPNIDELDEFPALPPKIKSLTEDSKEEKQNIVSSDATTKFQEDTQTENNENVQDTHMEENEDIPTSEFVKLFTKYCSSDWSPSPATNYKQCDPKNMEAVDSSLATENERHLALCLPPFSKEFYIATGYSKLQVSEEYAELIRVIVWQNRQRRKKGLPFHSPSEFELFLHEEMSQDFSDLGSR
jgi:hypothetical protein